MAAGGGAEQVAIFAAARRIKIVIHQLDGCKHEFGMHERVVRLLYTNAANGSGTPDHYDLIRERGDTEGVNWSADWARSQRRWPDWSTVPPVPAGRRGPPRDGQTVQQ